MDKLRKVVNQKFVISTALVLSCLLITVLPNRCDPNPCLNGGLCMVSKNNYTCLCDAGYHYDLVLGCQDVNECQSSACGDNEKCINSVGSFQCECLPGYKFNNVSGKCNDIDECLSKVCGTYPCQNENGSYVCVCPPGMNFNLSFSSTCIDMSGRPAEAGSDISPTPWLVIIVGIGVAILIIGGIMLMICLL